MTISVYDRVENILGKKRKLLVASIFFFSRDVLKASICKLLKVRTVW